MRLNPDRSTRSGVEDPRLDDLVEELTERLQANESVDVDSYARRLPERASEIRRLLPALRMLAELGRSVESELSRGDFLAREAAGGRSTLGDFRLVREIGRGGMGVVYEAEQISLHRRVAVKVLPLASSLDPNRLARFQTEAQLAAQLHHTNIVPVHAVGCEGGVHYYAMQFIAGRSIAELVAELRRDNDESPPGAATPATPGPGNSPAPRGVAGSSRTRARARASAAMMLQAAEGLAAAHDEGVVHRDIKPANLMIDDHGHLWVTDFGLARLQSEAGLTLSGDVLGTLRYISPEQALGHRAAIDQRTDLYGVGITFYELLALRPAFEGTDHRALVRRILDEEPTPIRRLNPAVPRDLETIVHKAMAKEPRDRYPTARALAEDLRRFLDGRPILATRPGRIDHALKWARRRWKLAGAAAAGLTLLTLLALGGLSWSNARLRALAARLAAEKDRADRLAAEESRQRALADRRLALSDRHLHATRLRLARQAIDLGQMERAQDILDKIGPSSTGVDPRGFAWHYLQMKARREIIQFPRHISDITRLRLLDKGRRVAYGTESGDLYIADVATETIKLHLAGFSSGVNRLLASSDGRLLVTSASQSATEPSGARIWDTATGAALGRVEMPDGYHARENWLSASGRVLSIWGKALGEPSVDKLFVFDLADASRPALVGTHDMADFSTPPSPNGACYHLSGNGDLDAIDLLSGRRSRIATVPDGPHAQMDLAPDGLKAVLRAADPTKPRVLIDVASGRIEGRCALNGLEVARIEQSDGSRVVALIGVGGQILIWDRARDRQSLIVPEERDRSDVSVWVAFSRDGRTLAYALRGNPGGQGPIRIVDTETGKARAVFPGRRFHLGQLEFHPDGRSLFIDSGNCVKRWVFDQDGLETPSLAGHSAEAWAVAFSPSGRMLATGSDDVGESKTIKIWDVTKGRLHRAWNGGPATISALAFSPDGLLTSAGLEQTRNLRIWKYVNRVRFELVGHTAKVRTIAYAPDGKLLASGGSDRVIRLWNPADGNEVGLLEGHEDNVRQVAFSPDGRILASASTDHTVRLWDVAARRSISIIDGPGPVSAVAFSAKGVLAVADEEGLIRLIDPGTSRELSRIHAEDGEVRALAFTPDGEALATGGTSRTIQLWDVLTGQELLVLEGHEGQINALAFSPSGMTLASAGHDGAVKLWRGGDANHP